MPFEFGDVVLVPFPFTDQTRTKQRPAAVVSSSAYNAARPDVVLRAITSQFRPVEQFCETWLRDWEAAGLLKPSAAKPLLATFEQALVIRRLGRLTMRDEAALKDALRKILAP